MKKLSVDFHPELAALEMASPADAPLLARRIASSGKRDRHGRDALMAAAEDNRPVALAALLPFSDPLAVSDNGHTALMLAASEGRIECLRALLPVSDPNARRGEDGPTALMLAIARPDEAVECIRLLAPLSDPDLRDGHGLTPLMRAATAVDPAFVEALLPFSDPAATNPRGLTALMLAAKVGNAAAVRALLPVSDVETRCDRGLTALHYAASSVMTDDLAALEALLPVSDWTSAAHDGATPFKRALHHPTAYRLAAADRLSERAPSHELQAALAAYGPDELPRAHARAEALELAAAARIGFANPFGELRGGEREDLAEPESQQREQILGRRTPRSI